MVAFVPNANRRIAKITITTAAIAINTPVVSLLGSITFVSRTCTSTVFAIVATARYFVSCTTNSVMYSATMFSIVHTQIMLIFHTANRTAGISDQSIPAITPAAKHTKMASPRGRLPT